MPTAFEKLIIGMPKDFSVMDVGYGGLDGENTTNFLLRYFNHVDGLNKEGTKAADFAKRKEKFEGCTIIGGTYPEDMPDKEYDLLVLDPNIETNIKFWYDGVRPHLEHVKEGGYLITYLHTAVEYGDNLTRRTLEAMWKEMTLEGLMELQATPHFQEERRPEITWFRFKK